MELIEKFTRENPKEYAYRALKYNIMSLKLKPGQNINESELAQKLNISRTPIREILMRLKEEHLIEVRPQVGTYVSLLDKQLIEEAYFMRYFLEKEVFRLACSSFPEDRLIELERNLLSQKCIIENRDKEFEFHKLDIEFHGIIFSGIKLDEVWEGILRISTHYNRLRFLFEIKYSNSISFKQHEKFFNAIKNRDIKSIEVLIEEHLKTPRNSWENIFNDYPEYSKYFKE